MNNFLTRTLSGFFFVLVILGSIWIDKFVFAAVFTIISGWTVFEFHKLTNQQQDVQVVPAFAVIGAVILFLTSFLHSTGILQYPSFSFYGLYIVMVLVTELFRQKKNPINNWAYFLLGQIIIALPFSLLNFIGFMVSDNPMLIFSGEGEYNPLMLMAVFVTIWVNDSGAYVFGVTLGKHRMFERVSPKKSWEGFFGGAITALISGYIFSLIVPEISLIQWLIFSEIVVIFGTFGDLLESLMKRTIHVKDSGDVIPGHGGLLDRFDSMLLVAPAIFIYLSFLFR